jgi:MFS superfamily sulfate permease-like transporter
MSEHSNATPDLLGRIARVLPIVTWLPSYERTWLRADIMAGLAVWAMTVPQALAYAGIAGVPPVYGLYTVPLAMIAYALFGTSRTLCVGPESAIAIISAITVGALVLGDPGEYLVLTALLTFMVGILYLLFGFLRLGWVASFLAQPVLQGFTQGIALTVMMSQVPTLFGTESGAAAMASELRNLPQLLGFELEYTGFLLKTWTVLATLDQAHLYTAAVGLGSLALLFAFRFFRPLAPSSLIAVALAVLLVWILDLEAIGVTVVGQVETGMINLALPVLDLDKIASLMPGALAIVLLGYAVSISVAKVGAATTGEQLEPNQELVGLGVANLGSAFSSGFVVCGSLSRGSVILRAGGRTQVVSLINAALLIVTLVFALPLFFQLPMATLSAIVIVAMFGLLDFGYFRRLLQVSIGEFAYAMAACCFSASCRA